jgi:8-oxo-dGTP pyrophosphatase MutT (NUDIX family)
MFVLESLLDEYNPSDINEIVYKSQMLTLLRTCPDCFNRSSKLGHFTASSWLLNKDESKFLLMHHRKLDIWLQLGGHADGNQNLLDVAIKEAREESGLFHIEPISEKIFDIDIHLFPKINDDEPHYHFDIRFLLRHHGDESLNPNNESNEVRWFSRDEFDMKHHFAVTRMYNKWIELVV